MKNTSKYPIQDEEEFFTNKQNSVRTPSMHLTHNEKKYHVQFLKDYHADNTSHHPTNNRPLLLTDRLTPNNIESLLSAENSTTQGHSSKTNTSDIHRESKKFNQN